MVDVVLLADPNSNVWEFSNKIHDYIKSKYYGTANSDEFPLCPLEIKYFRNKEFLPYAPNNVRRKEVYFIADSSLDPSVWLTQLLLVKDMLLSASAERINFVLPNLLFSRQDRKHKPHVPISARAVANALSPGLSRIITLDMHASQVQGFYPSNLPVDNLHSFPILVDYLVDKHSYELENLVLISPDAGGVTRTRAFTNQLSKRTGRNYSIAVINKFRSQEGELESLMELAGHVEGKNVLTIDDIIDSGGTLCEGADLLRNHGALKIMGYGTHGLFTKGYKELLSKFDNIITSNTMPIKNKTVEVIHVEDLFAQAIYRDYKGESISELF